ncbi:hypothetical protein ACVWW4_003903 [Bradyrhizobium sp. LB7.1]
MAHGPQQHMTAPKRVCAARSSLQANQYSMSINRVSQLSLRLLATNCPMAAPTAASCILRTSLLTTSLEISVSESTLSTRSPNDRRIAAICALRFPTLLGSRMTVNLGSCA